MGPDDPQALPPNLPRPRDDGSAAHLPGRALPAVALPSTAGRAVDLDRLDGRTIVFAYPRTGRPGEEPLGGTKRWDAIPGARGCTPQVCAIRDTFGAFAQRGVRVLGLSTQSTDDQREAVERLKLPYPLLSDVELTLATALDLPTFTVEGITVLERITLLVRDARIEEALYPVFPPDRAAEQALAALDRRAG